MVTAAAQVKPFITGNEIKSNKKPAGDTMKQLIPVVAEASEHKDGRDSHSASVWLNRGSNICRGGKWLGCNFFLVNNIELHHLIQSQPKIV